jgi:HAD superfamily hydrolase (TIGR01509 family)
VFKAILWDNDGVLVDTERLYFQATAEQLARVGVALSEADYLEYFLRQSCGAWHLAHERGVSVAETDALRDLRDARYLELIATHDVLLPGVERALTALAGRFRMAIVTSSQPRPFEAIHQRARILHHFEFALTRRDYAESKPHPEPYLRALERLQLAAADCLVIEDSERGLAAANAAGLTCWIVPSAQTRACRFAGADRVLANLDAVVAALR